MVYTSDKQIIRLDELCVTQLTLDYSFAVMMWEESRSLRFTIEVPFEIHIEGGSYALDPNLIETLCPSLKLLHKPVSFFEANRQGNCRLHFEDDTELRVSKHSEFESWKISGAGQLGNVQMLCSPHEGPPWDE